MTDREKQALTEELAKALQAYFRTLIKGGNMDGKPNSWERFRPEALRQCGAEIVRQG